MPYKYNPFTRMLDLVQNGSSGGSSGELQTGSIIWWPQDTPPEGWLKCDGSLVSKLDYPDLFDVVGYTFGEASGSKATSTHTDATSDTGTVSADSIYSADYDAWKAFDGVVSYTDSVNNWRPKFVSGDHWIQYQFVNAQRIKKHTIHFGPINYPDRINYMAIQASNDGVTFVDLLLVGDIPWGDKGIYEIDSVDTYKYYRLLFHEGGLAADYQISEWEMFTTDDNLLFGLPNINTGINNVIAIIKT